MLTVTGSQPQNIVLEILKDAHFYIQSSYWEGFGLAALEGMSLGLPTLLTDVPGLNELHNISSLTIKSKISPEIISQRLLDTSLDLDSYEKFALECYSRSCTFTSQSLLNSYYDAYHCCSK